MQFPLEEFNEYWPQFNMKKQKTGCIKKKNKSERLVLPNI